MSPAATETVTQIQCTKQGGPFKAVQVPRPQPGPTEILIRQRAIAFNQLDGKQRDYGVMVTQWPEIFGIEGAGTVEAVGSAVRNFQPGDEVLAWEKSFPWEQEKGIETSTDYKAWGGAYQELVAIPAEYATKKPRNISMEEAATLPSTYVTAACMIIDNLKIPLPFLPGTSREGGPPASALVLGGSSAVGAAIIQLLRIAYPDLPILATSSAKHIEHLKGLGASTVVDYRKGSPVAELIAASPGKAGVDVILDCVSAGASQTDVFDIFRKDGPKMYSDLINGIPVTVPEGVTRKEGTASAMWYMKGGFGLIPALTELVESGKYKVPVAVKVVGHGLEKIPDVMDEAKNVSGEKAILTL